MIWDVHPGFGFFFHPGSRIRTPDAGVIKTPDPGSAKMLMRLKTFQRDGKKNPDPGSAKMLMRFKTFQPTNQSRFSIGSMHLYSKKNCNELFVWLIGYKRTTHLTCSDRQWTGPPETSFHRQDRRLSPGACLTGSRGAGRRLGARTHARSRRIPVAPFFQLFSSCQQLFQPYARKYNQVSKVGILLLGIIIK
jgi:hypothetical protein